MTDAVTCYIGLGSNLQDPIQQVQTSLMALEALDDVVFVQSSSLYKTTPLLLNKTSVDQPDYINAVAEIKTHLSAVNLLLALQTIENNQGRVRDGGRWQARTIDLDILLYGQRMIKTDQLIIPHAELNQRDFVLYPLFEIAPELEVPGLGKVSVLWEQCENRGISPVNNNVLEAV